MLQNNFSFLNLPETITFTYHIIHHGENNSVLRIIAVSSNTHHCEEVCRLFDEE